MSLSILPDDLYDFLHATRTLIPNQLAGAEEQLEEGLAAAVAYKDLRSEKYALFLLGVVRFYQADYAEAIRVLERGLKQITYAGDESLNGQMLNTLATVYRQLGDFTLAATLYEEGRALALSINDKAGVIRTLNGLASIQSNLGDYNGAIIFLKEALQMTQQDDLYSGAVLLGNLSNEHSQLGQYETALELGLSSVEQLTQIGREQEALFALSSVARSYEGVGDLEKALQTHQKAYSIAVTHNLTTKVVNVDNAFGEFYLRHGKLDEAALHFERVLQTLPPEYHISSYVTYKNLAEIYKSRGDFERACEYLERYIEFREKTAAEESVRTIKNLEIRHKTEQAMQKAAYFEQQSKESETQRALERAYFERINEIRDDLIRSASHDLKNPLTRINLNVGFLRRSVEERNANLQRYINNIESASSMMLKLITDMLDLLRAEDTRLLSLGSHPVRTLLSDLETAFLDQANAKNLTLTIDRSKDFYATFDLDLMQRVLHNLVSNAIKYTLDGGKITVTATLEDNRLLFVVQDTGVGISEYELARIFDRFSRGQQHPEHTIEGTGLGLAICKAIVEKHDGQISVISQPGLGTTMTIAIPQRSVDASANASPPDAASASASYGRPV